MTRRWVRAMLVLILLGVIGGAGYEILLTEQANQREHEAERGFMSLAWQLEVALSDLRAAQEAYVAAGQSSDYWTGQVSALLDAITGNLTRLRELSAAGETAASLDEAAGVIETLRQMDGLVRDHSAAGQQLLASDLIFTDGMELIASASRDVDEARARERAARDRAGAERRQRQILALTAATGTSLLVALLLMPIGRPPQPAAVEASEFSATDARPPVKETGAGRLADLDLSLERDRRPSLSAAETARDMPATPPETAAPNLGLAAEVCTELSRLDSATGLPAVLARVSSVLNASGIIVWVRTPDGNALQAAVGHGYPPSTITRLGLIHRDHDNAVAAAFRTGVLQIVSGAGAANGAVAAPLLSATSCVGVMSAELRNGWETSDAVRATASILAAQLTTLVAPAEEVQARQAQG